MYYKLSLEEENQHFLNIEFKCSVTGKDSVEVQLPAWRPGRYQLANFAKNIQKFHVSDENGSQLNASKIAKDRWVIETNSVNEIIINYNYYAVDFDAGSTYVGNDVLYVNPVNCFLYVDEYIDSPCQVFIPCKQNQKIAGLDLTKESIFEAKTFHELVDTPFLISSKLQEQNYSVNDTIFHVWFYGECKPQWEKVITDFKKFTTYQLDKFGSIPTKKYHFLNIIHPYKAYHGVEHINSTVITLGPSYDVFDSLYTEFLGVSSHELYHVWNIKTIRPVEMQPYQYDKENYSRLGYVAEGVTTYMGDLVLYEAGVFDKSQYIKEFNQYLKRHFFNDGRLNLSVADSSFDTWLDGYDLGIPSRKSSIYIEGALIAFMTDVNIRKESNGKYSLHDVMKDLYHNFGLKGIGYSEEDYKITVEKYLGYSWGDFYKKYVAGINSFEEELTKCIDFMGYSLNKKESKLFSHKLGFVGQNENNLVKVIHVKENSVAYKAGLSRGDVIQSINGISINSDLDNWLEYFQNEKVELLVNRNSMNRITSFVIGGFNNQFYNYFIEEKNL